MRIFQNPVANTQTQLARIEVCEQCPMKMARDKCKECGCYIAYKVMLVNSKCPLNKW